MEYSPFLHWYLYEKQKKRERIPLFRVLLFGIIGYFTKKCFWCSALGDCLKRMRELTEALIWLACAEITVQLVARGLVIESASLRRCDSEGSPEQCWGLGNLVESNEWFCSNKGEFQYIRSTSGMLSTYQNWEKIPDSRKSNLFISSVFCSLLGEKQEFLTMRKRV